MPKTKVKAFDQTTALTKLEEIILLEREASELKERIDAAKAELRGSMEESSIETMTFNTAYGKWKVTISAGTRTLLDKDEVRKYLTPEQIESCTKFSPYTSFLVKPVK